MERTLPASRHTSKKDALTRRSLIWPGLGYAAAVATRPVALGGAEAHRPPNVVIFLTDDESWLERSAYGWSKLPTPNFDRVAKKGVLFTHGYTSAPSCAPSRASLLTGRNFWELEQGAFIQAWLPKKFPVFPELLGSSGYLTGHTAKGWGPGVYPPEGHGRESTGPAFDQIKAKQPEEGINPIDYAANFASFLDSRRQGQPFFFWVGVTEPHAPVAKDNYRKLEQRYGVTLKDIRVPGFMPDTPAIRRHRANMAYEICRADEQLGKVLDILEKRRELDNTIVIVTGDNGSDPSEAPRSKATPYDWGVHVPFSIMWPDRVKGGRTVEDFVSFCDLAPTILQAAGAEVPKSMSGRSILDILVSGKSGQIDATRDHVVTGLEWHGELSPMNRAGRMIRDKRYEYVINYGNMPGTKLDSSRRLPDSEYDKTAETATLDELLAKHPGHPKVKPFVALLAGAAPRKELYDLEKDPWEFHNLIDDPAYAKVRERLEAKLRRYQLERKDPRATGEMTIFEETRRFVEQRKRQGYSRE